MRKSLKILLHWLLMAAAALGCFTVQLLFMKYTGESSSSFLFSSRIYHLNPVCVTVGYLLFPLLHLVLWHRFQRKEISFAAEKGTAFCVGYCLIVLLFCFAVFLLSVWILFAGFTGMTNNIRPEFVTFDGLIFAAYIFLFTVISLIAAIKKNRR